MFTPEHRFFSSHGYTMKCKLQKHNQKHNIAALKCLCKKLGKHLFIVSPFWICTNPEERVHSFHFPGLCLQPVVILAALQCHAHLLSAPFYCTAPHEQTCILSRHLSQFNPLNITSHFVFCHNSLQLIICLINYICAVGRKACDLHLIKCSRLNQITQ